MPLGPRELLQRGSLLLLVLLLLHGCLCRCHVLHLSGDFFFWTSGRHPAAAAAKASAAAGAAAVGAAGGRCRAPSFQAAATLTSTDASAAIPSGDAAAAAVPSEDAVAKAAARTRDLSLPLGFLGLGGSRARSRLLEQQRSPLAQFRDSRIWRCCSSMFHAYKKIPLATRSWVSLGFLLSLLGSGDPPLVAPEALCMHWGRLGRALEIWRPFTGALFQGPVSFSTATRLYATYVALRQLEETERQALLQQPCSNPKTLSARRQRELQQQQQQLLQQQRELQQQWKDPKGFAEAAAAASGTAHLLQFLAVECLLLGAAGGALGMPFYGGCLTASATYLLSRHSPDRQVPFPLGLQVPHWALPFALAAIDALQQQSLKGAFPALLGIATGHAFYFLKKVVPAKTGLQVLPFPSLTYRLLLQRKARAAAGTGAAAAPRSSSKFLR